MHEVMKWSYKRKDGNVIGHVIRLENEKEFDTSKSRKQIIPYFNDNGQAGIPSGFPAHHRIYGVDSIKNYSEPLFIVEGEKCAYALQTLGFQAVTSLGGCGQCKLADWSIVKGFKQVYILPDNDKAGQQYAYTVYNQIRKLKSLTVKIVNCSTVEKGDVCDYLQSLTELKNWNGFDSLAGNAQVKNLFKFFVESNAEEIPASWKFIVTKNKHKLICLNDFKRLKLPKRNMLLFPWLPEGSINMIFADRGIGKTFFALSCALALANGDEFLCYKAEEAVPVLYLDGEMQAVAMQGRLKKLSQGKSTVAPLNIYTPDCQDVDYTPDLGTVEGKMQINELIEAVNPKVIFIDNISTFDRTGNENEAESWAPIQEWAVQHRKKGRSIVFVHHANKEGKQRGSHKKEDVMDAVIKLKRPDDYIQGEGSTKILVQYTKARHLSGEMVQDIEATLHGDADSFKWEWEQGDIIYRKAVEMIKNKVPMRDIAEELGVGKSTVHRWKSKAQSEGLI
ncbi:MAG: AAA family ATPase [Proteobacteria bacterium]|nr:AAA family ATPase [Pseudomonadota bacterium]